MKPLKHKFTDDTVDVIIAVGTVLVIMVALWMFTGQWFFKSQPYNSYVLQAQSWLDGRLHLGKDYPYLELAIYDGNYYVSFPPFPSYLMLPFVALGWDSCDGTIALVSALLGVACAVKIMHTCGSHGFGAVVAALLLTVGSNWLYFSQNAWVWFIAQNLSFTLCLMAIYYAMNAKARRSLAFWGCAVGCRPFSVIYIFVLLYLLYDSYHEQYPDKKLAYFIRKNWICAVPVAVIAVSYMVLNYARFGNIAEFGHNYLPEFTREATGQFNILYMRQNLSKLFRIPEVKNGIWQFPLAEGFNIFISSPIFFVFVIVFAYGLINGEKKYKTLYIMTFVLIVLHLLFLTLHRTMGGSHFGNRYPCDALPFAFMVIALAIPKNKNILKLCTVPLMFGLVLNALGAICSYVK